MNKTALIFRHEFITTIRRRAYIVFTLAFPVIGILVLLGSQVISGMTKPPPAKEVIGYVDNVGTFTEAALQGDISLQYFDSENSARTALLAGNVKEYFIIAPDYLKTGLVQRYTLQRELDASAATVQVIRNFLLSNLLKGNNSPDIIARAEAPLNMVSTLLDSTGAVAPNQGGFASFIIPYIFSLLLLMSIFFSSGYLLQGLGEEKENRVMEILLSSVSPQQLLGGKVLGLGAAGLLQIIVWLVSALFLANTVSSTFGAVIGTLQVPVDFMILGVVYFMLGYLLFAVLMAGVGAISPSAREAQQFSTIFSLLGVIPLFFMQFIIENPNHIVSQILTIFPITAPITVMIRLGLINIPLWQLAASVVVMLLTILGCFVVAAKLFRTYLLMYGKRPELGEIWRSIRQS